MNAKEFKQVIRSTERILKEGTEPPEEDIDGEDYDDDYQPLLVAIVEGQWKLVTQALQDELTDPEEVANGIIMVSDNPDQYEIAPAGKGQILAYELGADQIKYITGMKRRFGLSLAYDNNYLMKAAYRFGYKDLFDLLSRDNEVKTSLQQEDPATYKKLVASVKVNDADLRDEILNGPWSDFETNWVEDGAEELFG